MGKNILKIWCGAVVIFCFVVDASQIVQKNACNLRLLIKIPSQNSQECLFDYLDKYYQYLSDDVDCHFLISLNSNDLSMNCPYVTDLLQKYKNLNFYFAPWISKVESWNRDLEKHVDFDVVMIVSDNLVPIIRNYNKIICDKMLQFFPDMDGVIQFAGNNFDSDVETCFCFVIGRKFYNRFGYIYHPFYKTKFASHELIAVAHLLNKFQEVSEPLFKVLLAPEVNLYDQEDLLLEDDKIIFELRKAIGFSIDFSTQKIVRLSILIPTLQSRKFLFDHLIQKLKKQINSLNLQDNIEIVINCDNREKSVGRKRNELLEQSRGEYECFIDDDDDIHENYVEMIYDALKGYPDCVGLTGIVTRNGVNSHIFIHSLRYKKYFEQSQIYYRPPNHLNVIRRDIAIRFKFKDKFCAEDTPWAMQICESGLLKKEVMISTPYYFYLWNAKNSVQRLNKIRI